MSHPDDRSGDLPSRPDKPREPTLLEELERVLSELAAEPMAYQSQVRNEFSSEFMDLCWSHQDEVIAALRYAPSHVAAPGGQIQPHDVGDALRWGMHRGEIKSGDPQRVEMDGAFDFNTVAEYLNGAFAKSARLSSVAAFDAAASKSYRAAGIDPATRSSTVPPALTASDFRLLNEQQKYGAYAVAWRASAPSARAATPDEARTLLIEAQSEMKVIASYADDPQTNVGLRATAQAYRRVIAKISDYLRSSDGNKAV